MKEMVEEMFDFVELADKRGRRMKGLLLETKREVEVTRALLAGVANVLQLPVPFAYAELETEDSGTDYTSEETAESTEAEAEEEEEEESEDDVRRSKRRRIERGEEEEMETESD